MASDDSTSAHLRAFINPLVFFGIEFPAIESVRGPLQEPSSAQILDAITTPGVDASPAAIQARCRELRGFWSPVVMPEEGALFEKLLWPLRQAKANYCLGNFVATIGLCGMVGEMITSTYLDASPNPLPHKNRDRVTQDTKIKELLAANIISAADSEALHDIRKTRNEYVHWWTRSHTEIQGDSRRLYGEASGQLRVLTFAGWQDGWALFPPLFRAYLERKGLIRPAP